MFKNVSAQKVALFAFTPTTALPKTGDAANITVYVSKDHGTPTPLTDGTATELSATNQPGWYTFDLTQAETNANELLFTGKSSTADVVVVGDKFSTYPAFFSSLSIDTNGRMDLIKIAGTTQTARDIGASVLLSPGTGTGQVNLTSGAVPLVGDLTATMKTSVATAVFAKAFASAYGSYTFEQMVGLIASICAGKVSGAGTTTITVRKLGDTGNVAVFTNVDGVGNRPNVALTP